MRSTAFASLSVVAFSIMFPSAAAAQETTRAQALFDEGRRLMSEGRYAEACPKLKASQKLDPGAGTLMNLGSCYEKNGQLASAWATFREAAPAARLSQHPEWEGAAKSRADSLEARLPRLAIHVSPGAQATAGIVVERDGSAIDHAEWGAAIPVDSGVHVIRAHAPGRRTWTTEVTITGSNATDVTVMPLDSEGTETFRSSAPLSRSAHDAPPQGGSQRLVGILVASAGGAGLITGAVLGVMAKSSHDDALTHCNAARQCDARGLTLDDRATSMATAATVSFIAGGALALGGAALYFSAPRSDAAGHHGQTKETLRISVGAGPLGVKLGGAF